MAVHAEAGREPYRVSDADRDSLHILPLAIIPLKTPVLKRACMIKNVRLDTVIELFSDGATGSGQIGVGDASKEFGWPEVPPHPDVVLLRKLVVLPSFDVYSLRILLRESGIPVDGEELKLSPGKVQELSTYMAAFTRPLVQEIFGGESVEVDGFSGLLQQFRNPDVRKVQQKLQQIADKLSIGIDEIPKFLEDYGDIFLSLSYYRQCLDKIVPGIETVISSIDQIRHSHQMRTDVNLMRTCSLIETTMNERLTAITGRIENFDRGSSDLWKNLTAERFRKVEGLIRSYHTTIGGVLCALSVKLNAWNKLFPNAAAGGPVRRAEFIMSEMKQGINRIQKIEDSAPLLAAVG